MPKINHGVNLTDVEIESLKSITHKGSGESARTIMHANILLLSNDRIGDKKRLTEKLPNYLIFPQLRLIKSAVFILLRA